MTSRPLIVDLIIQNELSSLVDPAMVESFYGLSACSFLDGNYFFSEHPSEIQFARKICARCNVKSRCLEEAIEQDLEGIWGGRTHLERQNIASRRPNIEITKDEARAELRKLVNSEVRGLADSYQVNERTIHRWRARILESDDARALLGTK